MRHCDVKSLGDDASIDLLVHDYSDSSFIYIEHNTGSTVIMLEGHTLVDGRVHFNIHIITTL